MRYLRFLIKKKFVKIEKNVLFINLCIKVIWFLNENFNNKRIFELYKLFSKFDSYWLISESSI